MPGASVYSYNVVTPDLKSGYAANGNLTNYTDSVMGQSSFQYDNLNRLVSGSTGNEYLCWNYDNFGNMLAESASSQQIANFATCAPATGATSYINTVTNYDTNNKILNTNARGTSATPPYDASGNMLGDGANTYAYDSDGRVCAVSTPGGLFQYLYDASGHRVGKGTIQAVVVGSSSYLSCDVTLNNFTLIDQYVIGPSGEQMTEFSASYVTTANPAGWVHTNVIAGGVMATYLNDTTSPHFRLTDWVGTTRAQTNASGVLELTCTSLPFGDGQNCVSASTPPVYTPATEQFFTGYERDTETGNVRQSAKFLRDPHPCLGHGPSLSPRYSAF